MQCNFMSCIIPRYLVRHFHVLHFQRPQINNESRSQVTTFSGGGAHRVRVGSWKLVARQTRLLGVLAIFRDLAFSSRIWSANSVIGVPD